MILTDPWISLVSNIGILCLIPMDGIKISISFARIEKGSIIFVIGLSRHPRSVMFTEWPFQGGSDDHLPQNSSRRHGRGGGHSACSPGARVLRA